MPKPASTTAHERRPSSFDKLKNGSSQSIGDGSHSNANSNNNSSGGGSSATVTTTADTVAAAADAPTKSRKTRRHELAADLSSEVVTLSTFTTTACRGPPPECPKNGIQCSSHAVPFSCAPAVWWGAPPALLLLFRLAFQLGLLKGHVSGQVISLEKLLDARLGLTESALAIVWVRLM